MKGNIYEKNQTNHSLFLIAKESIQTRQEIDVKTHEKINSASKNFCYSKSKVLKNKHGIKEASALKKQCIYDVKKQWPDCAENHYQNSLILHP
ncbi:hypothetical protein [Bartonella henselae]|uniref:hypothetical protein n=1 Tax=Bartonella henselae TaxID=38323 RepID=UPI00031DCE4D|nr:hypothetical protein [Bartonella henselae]ATP12790.1 hypothetical protein BhenCHDE101_06860 [Bartonella henselae]MDM9983795.1 hypothetical protein [Bartonella henselae]MDM9984696.1 hypothetical protein [Bartonella henselae]MDM9986027.1 hypothetical protein [Bartonella henselae]MDM9987781.1 hypothetical protein [Bartonella henselae]